MNYTLKKMRCITIGSLFCITELLKALFYASHIINLLIIVLQTNNSTKE